MGSIIFDLINQELAREQRTINLIASENYTSREVLDATGSVLTNKYAEGYPGKRYYGGCEVVDKVEQHAIDLAKKLFDCDHVNVQPHSGSSANFAVYFSSLSAGDTVLGMNLAAGGHLTHGHKLNFSGTLFNIVSYGVDATTELIDYDEIERLAAEHKPKMIIAGASAYSRIIDYARFREIADRHDALLFVDMAHIAGLVATGVHPSPIPFADIVSTTTHKTLRGPRGGLICAKQSFARAIDRAVMPGCQGGPLLNVIAAKAIAFEEALRPEFCTYQKKVVSNAQAMAQKFSDLGYKIVSGGTDNHLFLIDVTKKGETLGKKLNGLLVEQALWRCNIVLNRNAIPFDTASPMSPSGIRIGTPAMTTRGFGEREVIQVVHWIDEAIQRHDDEAFLSALQEKVLAMCANFPVYG